MGHACPKELEMSATREFAAASVRISKSLASRPSSCCAAGQRLSFRVIQRRLFRNRMGHSTTGTIFQG
jgi:hypothetical protein